MAPSKAPIKAPTINCDSSISTVAYINCITVSNRTLTLNGTTAEDLALQWLVKNDTLALVPTSDANRARLRQRFALLTWGFQVTSGWFYDAPSGKWFNVPGSVHKDLEWNLTAPNECDWFPNPFYADFGFQCADGQVTYIYGTSVVGTVPPDLSALTALKSFYVPSSPMVGTLPPLLGWWTNLTYFDIAGGTVQGTLPSSIGAWTALAWFDITKNKFTGTIPSTISAWKAIDFASFDGNNLRGVMPAFASGFCPKQNRGNYLAADCKNSTGKATIVCACCNTCD
jgi:hypothetical protein